MNSASQPLARPPAGPPLRRLAAAASGEAAAGDSGGFYTERLHLKGAASGPLQGLTAVVKDSFDVSGHRTGNGSPAWRDSHPPVAGNAAAVQVCGSEAAITATCVRMALGHCSNTPASRVALLCLQINPVLRLWANAPPLCRRCWMRAPASWARTPWLRWLTRWMGPTRTTARRATPPPPAACRAAPPPAPRRPWRLGKPTLAWVG